MCGYIYLSIHSRLLTILSLPLLTKPLQESIFRVLSAVLSAVLPLGNVACGVAVPDNMETAVVHVKQHIAIAARRVVSIVLYLLLGVDVEVYITGQLFFLCLLRYLALHLLQGAHMHDLIDVISIIAIY